MIRKLFSCAIATILFAGAAGNSYADVYSTSFDGPEFSAGTLHAQGNWVAQTQWQANGAGSISNDNGAFIRAHTTDVLGSTAIGETMEVSSTFTLGAFSTPSTDILVWEEGIFVHAMSHQQGNQAFSAGLAVGLHYDVGTGNLELRSAQGSSFSGTTLASLGAASGLGGTTHTLTTSFTKTATDTWDVVASLGATSISYTASGQSSDLDTDSDGGGIIGGFQALPSGGGSGGVATAPFASTTVSDFSISVTAVPEPGSSTLLALGLMGFVVRRRR